MSAKQDSWQTSTCTSEQRSADRKNSRIGKSAILQKQPLLFSSKPLVGKGCFRSEEHTSELQSRVDLVCRLLLEKKKKKRQQTEAHRDDTRTPNPQNVQ